MITKELNDQIERIRAANERVTAQPHATPDQSQQIAVERFDAGQFPKRHRKRQSLKRMNGWGDTLKEVAERLDDGSGALIALVGQRGTGKTQLAVEIARECARRGSVRYATAMDFFLETQSTFQPKADKTQIQVRQEFYKPRLLVFDEMQERGNSPWEDRVLTNLIDKRYQDGKDTLLITNQSAAVFLESMGNSVSSRLGETGGVIECSWGSFRA